MIEKQQEQLATMLKMLNNSLESYIEVMTEVLTQEEGKDQCKN